MKSNRIRLKKMSLEIPAKFICRSQKFWISSLPKRRAFENEYVLEKSDLSSSTELKSTRMREKFSTQSMDYFRAVFAWILQLRSSRIILSIAISSYQEKTRKDLGSFFSTYGLEKTDCHSHSINWEGKRTLMANWCSEMSARFAKLGYQETHFALCLT